MEELRVLKAGLLEKTNNRLTGFANVYRVVAMGADRLETDEIGQEIFETGHVGADGSSQIIVHDRERTRGVVRLSGGFGAIWPPCFLFLCSEFE